MTPPRPSGDQINTAAAAVCTQRQRLILHLRYIESHTWDTIADALDLDRATVIRDARRCLVNIRRHLENPAA